MRNMLLRMLGALVCVLGAWADIVPAADFDLPRMEGKWFTVGFATNAAWFVDNKSAMKMGTAIFKPTETGDLDLSYATLNADGSCWKMTNLAKKTDTAGRFTFYNQAWGNDNDMRIVDVIYDQYALVHTIKSKDGVDEVLNQLYSRTSVISEELQQKFIEYAQQAGINADNIVILPQNAECP